MVVRRAARADYPSAAELLLELQGYHARLRPDVFAPARHALDPGDYGRLLDDPDAALFVADDGTVCGILVALLRDAGPADLFIGGRVAVVRQLFVSAGRRGSGIGAALMDAAERWARGRGASRLELNVWGDNASALDFYRGRNLGVACYRLMKPLR